MLGNIYRDGKIYFTQTVKVYDHDFNTFSDGVVIPHGIYDLKRNEGYITLGTSKDTSEFCCDCIKYWWENYGKGNYLKGNSILVLADGGGSNSSRHYIFKEDLQKLVNEIGIEIRMAHYPPYTSKYNPIEHRLFCHVTNACKGTVFSSLDVVKSLVDKASTSTGLKVFSTIKNKGIRFKFYGFQSQEKYNCSFICSYLHLGDKMDLETLKKLLASLNINPDEIEDERYATAFRILFAIIEKQNEEIEFLKAENQKLRDEINLLKGEQTKPKIRGSKKNEDISSEKERQKRCCP